MPGRTRPSRTVPSEQWPTVGLAVASSGAGGASIHVLPGHCEHLEVLILDQPFEIEGPADCSATLHAEHGIVCASPPGAALALRGLTLRSGHAPVLTIACPCTVEFCDISGSGVGVQLAPCSRGGDDTSPAGTRRGASTRWMEVGHCRWSRPASQGPGEDGQPYLAHNVIHGCAVGICFAGPVATVLDRNRIERNGIGVEVVGLELLEGDSDVLAPLDRSTFAQSTEADLRLSAVAVRDRRGAVRHCCPDVLVRRMGDACASAVSTDDGGPGLLRIEGGARIHVALGDYARPSGIGALPCRGRWRTGPLPEVSSPKLRERQRDFARVAAPNGAAALLVIGPEASAPDAWTRQAPDPTSARDVGAATGEAAAADLEAWLGTALRATPRPPSPGLAARCVALVGAGEGIGFALAFGLTPALLQPHFALFASASGEVRVAWLALVTDQPRPDQATLHELRLLRLLSEDLNGPASAGLAAAGAWMEFSSSVPDEPDVGQVLARSTGAFRRAADEDDWELVLGAG